MSTEIMSMAWLAREKETRLFATAAELHVNGWDQLLELARHGGPAKYGLYASRILTVPHPEIYLRADALFWQVASSTRGFRDAYGIRYTADMYMMRWFSALQAGEPLGEPLRWADVPAESYSVVRARSEYSHGHPFLPVLDQRLAPLAVSLKTWGNRITPLERAEHEYFRARDAGGATPRLFLVLCADESAYLAQDGELVDMSGSRRVDQTSANPILIFNEEVAWYPLMGRDDTAKAPALAQLVHRLGSAQTAPLLDANEARLAPLLREAARLESGPQVDMAMLAALRAGGAIFNVYDQVWKGIVKTKDIDNHNTCSRKLGIIRECNRYASSISPVSAYLAAILRTAPDQEVGLRLFSAEYLKQVGVVRDDEKGWKRPGRLEAWGHLWYCPLMEYTIDDSWRSGGGHCVSQAMSLSAALDLAGVDHYVTHFNRGGIQSMDHHFVSSANGEWVLDDAILNYYATGAAKTGDWGALLSFSKGGEWASLVLGEFFGNVSPERAREHVAMIEKLIGGRFPLKFLKLEGDELRPLQDWEAHLRTVSDWAPVTVP